MRNLRGIVVSASLCAIAGPALALEVGGAGGGQLEEIAAQRNTPVLPSPADLRNLERWLDRGDNYSALSRNEGVRPHPGDRIGVIGRVSTRYFQGGRSLHACKAWGSRNRFTSLDPRCEGQQPDTNLHSIGTIAGTQLPDTVPLYRCRRINQEGNWMDHYDSTDAACEGAAGAVNDGLLGYIWR